MKITIRDRALLIVVSILLFVYLYSLRPITSHEVLDYAICIISSLGFYFFIMYAAKLGENEYGDDEE